MHRRLTGPQHTSNQEDHRHTREVSQIDRRRRVASGALAVVALISACTDAGSSDTASPPTATAATASAAPEAIPSAATTSEATTSAPVMSSEPQTSQSASDEERIATVRARRQAMADSALLRPEDLGDGWRDDGPEAAFPMSAALAASVPSCTSFVDVVFEGNAAVWAHTALGLGTDIAFTSVTVFATDDEAAAMVAATNTAEFDECWADFNEVAVLELPYGIASATYTSVEPTTIELSADSWSLHALEGTLTLDSTELADTCVCAFVQEGRTVVAFHSAAPVFNPAERRDVIATAVARIDQEVE